MNTFQPNLPGFDKYLRDKGKKAPQQESDSSDDSGTEGADGGEKTV